MEIIVRPKTWQTRHHFCCCLVDGDRELYRCRYARMSNQNASTTTCLTRLAHKRLGRCRSPSSIGAWGPLWSGYQSTKRRTETFSISFHGNGHDQLTPAHTRRGRTNSFHKEAITKLDHETSHLYDFAFLLGWIFCSGEWVVVLLMKQLMTFCFVKATPTPCAGLGSRSLCADRWLDCYGGRRCGHC